MSTRVIGGTAWTVCGYATMQVFRFGFNVALARLVAPRVFGIMALVNLFLLGLHMFSDFGIRQCVVRHPRGSDPAFLNTAWTMQVIRGAGLWLAASALAWPMAAFYDEPAFLWLIPLGGFAEFIWGFSSTSLFTYSREVRRGPVVRREVGAYVASYTAVLIAVAMMHKWWPAGETQGLDLAIIALGMVGVATGEVALSFTLPAIGRPRFAWNPEARRELGRFGGWVFLSSTCTFFAAQSDRLVVGKLSLDLLGVYNIGVVIAAVPAGVLTALGVHLVFPLMSNAMREGEPLGGVFRKAHRILASAAGLLISGVACIGPAFINLLYDDRYAATADFIRYLAIAAWFTALLVPGELALLALGNTRGLAIGQVVRLACIPGFFYAGFLLGGVPGLILGVACGELVRYVVVAGYLSRAGIRVYPADAALTCLAALLLGVYVLVEEITGTGGRVAVPIIGTVMLTLFWLGVYAMWAAPVNLPAPFRWLAFGDRTTPDGVQS